MRYQDVVVRITDGAVKDLFRTARAVPADKLEWKPIEQGRSVLDQLQEVAQAPLWYMKIIEARDFPGLEPGAADKAREERSVWNTLEECESVCRENTDRLLAAVSEFPDSELEVMIRLPYGGGMIRSIADVMLFHYWNVVYHMGQVNYIQTLFGDQEMH